MICLPRLHSEMRVILDLRKCRSYCDVVKKCAKLMICDQLFQMTIFNMFSLIAGYQKKTDSEVVINKLVVVFV